MSLYDLVAGLQKKSERSKKRVLFALLAVSFLVLAIFWIIIFQQEISSLSSSGKPQDVAQVLGETDNILTPVAALVEGFKGLKSDLSSTLKEVGDKIADTSPAPRQVYELPVE